MAVGDEYRIDLEKDKFKIWGSVTGVAVGIYDSSGTQIDNFGGAGGGDGAILDGVTATIKATVLNYSNSNPLSVRLTDTNGDYVTAGGGTQYTEGDIDATITGTALMWEDASDTLRSVSVAKPLPVDIQNSSLSVTQSGTWNLNNISGVISLPTGAATESSVSSIDGKITVCNTNAVTINAALPSGTNNIGDVDVLTLPDVDINDISKGVQTNDLKITLDGETVTLSANDGVDIGDVTINNSSLAVTQSGSWNIGTELETDDLDTDLGTDTQAIIGIALAESGGHILVGSANPLPISGTVTANAGSGNFTVVQATASNLNCTEVNSSAIKTAVEKIDDLQGALKSVDTDELITRITDSTGTEINPAKEDGNLATVAGAVSGTEMQVDVVASLPTGSNAIGKVDHNISGINHGNKTVTTAGTDEVLAASTTCKKVFIQAQTDNKGIIAIGTSGVDATVSTGNGFLLYAGDSIEFEINNLNNIYLDATVDGEGVRYIYLT